MSYFDWPIQEKKNPEKNWTFPSSQNKKFLCVSIWAHLHTKSVGAIGNTFGEHIGDIWGHTGNMVGKLN
jgi:hypothetical protein